MKTNEGCVGTEPGVSVEGSSRAKPERRAPSAVSETDPNMISAADATDPYSIVLRSSMRRRPGQDCGRRVTDAQRLCPSACEQEALFNLLSHFRHRRV